ncbi:MAG TPA: SagB/ThcOx family dehydrogenase [bacterium]|nr:SagB/ThcOx family dehydrogenase [bacterium]
MSLSLYADTAVKNIRLPKPDTKSRVSVEQALNERRTERLIGEPALSLKEAGQLLWAAQGVTDGRGYRTAPSAGALFPLETYVAAGNVSGLEPGVYRYIPAEHALALIKKGDVRKELSAAAMGQRVVANAPITIIFSAVYPRITGRYGDRGIMYTHMEAGHAGQNIYLQAVSMGMATVAVGAFDEKQAQKVLGVPAGEPVTYVFPAGKKR